MSNEEKSTAQSEPESNTSSEESEEMSEEELKKQNLENFRKAGQIHKQTVEYIKPLVKVGATYLEICELTEAKIQDLGGMIGFPVNISVNEIAAHYSSPPDDEKVIQEGDIVKVDLGVAIEGCVADGAFTVSFNTDPRTENLIMAVQTAVLKGLSLVKPGVHTNELGKETSKIIEGFGYNPIKDLSGHKIEPWQVHAAKEIPNVPMPTGPKFEEGEIFALECFASTGTGQIHRSSQCYIYEYDVGSDRVPIRGKITRKVLGWLGKTKKTLPFSLRELIKEYRTGKFAIRELTNAGKLIQHNVLSEKKGEYVAQWEHTFLVTAEGYEQLT